jgi:hypothetical protein
VYTAYTPECRAEPALECPCRGAGIHPHCHYEHVPYMPWAYAPFDKGGNGGFVRLVQASLPLLREHAVCVAMLNSPLSFPRPICHSRESVNPATPCHSRANGNPIWPLLSFTCERESRHSLSFPLFPMSFPCKRESRVPPILEQDIIVFSKVPRYNVV